MNPKTKDILIKVAAALLIIVGGIWLFLSKVEHIEDTNGPDNYSLTTITDQNIIKRDMGATGLSRSKSLLTGDTHTFSSDKFTGVEEIMYNNYILNSSDYFTIYNYEIKEGNMKMVVVLDDEIIAELEPGMVVEYDFKDVNGTLSLRIAGESAAFRFDISGFDLDRFEQHLETND